MIIFIYYNIHMTCLLRFNKSINLIEYYCKMYKINYKVSMAWKKEYSRSMFEVLSKRSTNVAICYSEQNSPSPKHKARAGINNKQEASFDVEYERVYLRLLRGNRQYVREMLKHNPNYFKDISVAQKPKYLLIGCSDSRVPPNEMTKTDPGEIFIHRNIANQVLFSDLNCMSVIQYAVEHLKVEHIIVMGHTKCGGIHSSTKKKHKGLIEQWLQNIKDVASNHKHELMDSKSEDEFLNKLTILNVKAQALNVCKTPFVQTAWAKGQALHVHGWLMDIETGLIEDLSITNKDWDDIKHIYDLHFDF